MAHPESASATPAMSGPEGGGGLFLLTVGRAMPERTAVPLQVCTPVTALTPVYLGYMAGRLNPHEEGEIQESPQVFFVHPLGQ